MKSNTAIIDISRVPETKVNSMTQLASSLSWINFLRVFQLNDIFGSIRASEIESAFL